MASIQKRIRGGKTTYRVQYRDPSGAMRGKSFARVADARRFKTETEHAKEHGVWTDPRAGKAILRAYGDAHLAAQTFDETTREAVALRLRLHVYSHLGDYQLAALRPSVVQAWARGLQQQLAPSYVRVVFANLSAILQAAVDDGAIARNPCRVGSVKPPAPDRRKVLPWSAGRVVAVAAALPDRYQWSWAGGPPRRMKIGRPSEDVGVHWCCEPAYQWDAGASGHPGLLLRARTSDSA